MAQTIRIASFAGDDSDESHFVVTENEKKQRTIMDAFGSLGEARIYAKAIVKLSDDAEQGFPEKSERKSTEAA